MIITLSAPSQITSIHGDFLTYVGLFGDGPSVFVCGLQRRKSQGLLNLRVQYGCAHGAVFRSLSCDCGAQIDRTLELFGHSQDTSLFVYFPDHEAYGLGIFEKMALLDDEQRTGRTYAELVAEGQYPTPSDSVLWVIPYLLDQLGLPRRVNLLTDSASKIATIQKVGIEVVGMRSLKPQA